MNRPGNKSTSHEFPQPSSSPLSSTHSAFHQESCRLRRELHGQSGARDEDGDALVRPSLDLRLDERAQDCIMTLDHVGYLLRLAAKRVQWTGAQWREYLTNGKCHTSNVQ